MFQVESYVAIQCTIICLLNLIFTSRASNVFKRQEEETIVRDIGQTDSCEQKEVICSHQRCYGWMIQLLDGGRCICSAAMSPYNQWLRKDTQTQLLFLFLSKEKYWKLCTKSCTNKQTCTFALSKTLIDIIHLCIS